MDIEYQIDNLVKYCFDRGYRVTLYYYQFSKSYGIYLYYYAPKWVLNCLTFDDDVNRNSKYINCRPCMSINGIFNLSTKEIEKISKHWVAISEISDMINSIKIPKVYLENGKLEELLKKSYKKCGKHFRIL